MPEIALIFGWRRRAGTLAAMLAAAFCTPLSYAKDAPLWEFGLGAGAIAF